MVLVLMIHDDGGYLEDFFPEYDRFLDTPFLPFLAKVLLDLERRHLQWASPVVHEVHSLIVEDLPEQDHDYCKPQGLLVLLHRVVVEYHGRVGASLRRMARGRARDLVNDLDALVFHFE